MVHQPPDASEQLLLDRAVRLYSNNGLCVRRPQKGGAISAPSSFRLHKSELERRATHLGIPQLCDKSLIHANQVLL